MTAILFSKLGQITIRLTFLAQNLMNLAEIFQVSEHLNDFEIIGYGQNKTSIVLRQNICRPSHGLSVHSEAIAPIMLDSHRAPIACCQENWQTLDNGTFDRMRRL